jgi:hypothetical protein
VTGRETLPIYETEKKRNEKQYHAQEQRGFTPSFGQLDWHVKVQERKINTSTIALIVIPARLGSRRNNGGHNVQNSHKIFQTAGSSSRLLMRFLIISKDEKNMALTAHDRIMETPKPRYM